MITKAAWFGNKLIISQEYSNGVEGVFLSKAEITHLINFIKKGRNNEKFRVISKHPARHKHR